MSIPRVLVTRPIPDAGLALLRAAKLDYLLPESPPDSEALRHIMPQYEGVICQLADRIDEGHVWDAFPGCKIIATCSVGTDHIDLAAARAAGIHVTNTPGVLTEATADLAWALMLATARRIPESERLVRSGAWQGWEMMQMLGANVHGRTLGIVGAGRIGTAVARRATGFSMNVLYTTREDKPAMAALGARRVPLETLLAESDFVSLHCPLADETRHLLDRSALERMRPGAILINTARGPIVDEAALIDMLRDRRIAAAGFDVYEHEPRIPPELMALDNVVLLPHIGSATVSTRDRMAEMAAEDVIAVLDGKPPLRPVGGG